MANLPQSVLEQAGLKSGLLDQQQIDRAWERVAAAAATEDRSLNEVTDVVLADEFVASGILNRWQATQLQEGRTKFTLGPYRILDAIGRGGMGYVFKCEHELLGRIEAVKVLPRTNMAPASIASFRREIRAQAKLDHPNLVRLLFADRDGEIYYLVTEFVPGSDLRRLIHNHGPLSPVQAAIVISQTAEALAYVHHSGMVHRDVKPGNLLVTPDGHTKLADLGLATFSTEQPAQGRKSVVGTPDFLPPEAVAAPGETLPISDIYALGCSFYYAVTGKVPFPGGDTRNKLRRHQEELPLTPVRLVPGIDAKLVDLIAEMMRKNPSERISTTQEVVDRLAPWVSQADDNTWLELSESVTQTGRGLPEQDALLGTPENWASIAAGRPIAEPADTTEVPVAIDTQERATPDCETVSAANGEDDYFGLGRPVFSLIALAVALALAAMISAVINSR